MTDGDFIDRAFWLGVQFALFVAVALVAAAVLVTQASGRWRWNRQQRRQRPGRLLAEQFRKGNWQYPVARQTSPGAPVTKDHLTVEYK